MSDLTFFALSFVCGVFARVLFLPANRVAKSHGRVAAFFVDFACAIAGGAPFTALVFLCRNGTQTYYSLVALYTGMLTPSLFHHR